MPETSASPADGDRGWYVYGFIPPGPQPQAAQLVGVDERSAVTILEHEGIGAVVSEVPLDEFGDEGLRRNLNDPGWLEAKVRRHEAVLEGFMGGDALVPLRFCTIYRSTDQLHGALKDEHDRVAAALSHVRGRREWGVKAFSDEAALQAWIERTDERAARLREQIAASPGGSAYFARKKLEQVLREESAELAAECARRVHEVIAAAASEARANRPQRREVSGRDGAMILNGAYLVERAREGELAATAAEIASRYAELGISVEVTGPWPPYNFVPDELHAP